VTALAPDRHFAGALHLPVLTGRLAGRRPQNRSRWYGNPCILLRRNVRQGVRPLAVGLLVQRLSNQTQFSRLEIANFPRARRLTGAPDSDSMTNGSALEIEIARRAIAADRTDVIGLLPLLRRRPMLLRTSDPAWVIPYLLGRQSAKKNLPLLFSVLTVELYRYVLPFCQISIMCPFATARTFWKGMMALLKSPRGPSQWKAP